MNNDLNSAAELLGVPDRCAGDGGTADYELVAKLILELARRGMQGDWSSIEPDAEAAAPTE